MTIDRTPKGKISTRQIALAGVLGAITIVLGMSPVAFIRLGVLSITTMHIPTILAGILEGPVIGGIVGAMFGAFSMYQAQTIGGPAEKIMFSNPVIAVLPRILIGIVSYYVFTAVRGKTGRAIVASVSAALLGYTGYSLSSGAGAAVQWILGLALAGVTVASVYAIDKKYGHGPALAAAAGSLTNTLLVLSLVVAYGHIPGSVALAVGVTNGLPEAAGAVILTTLVYRGTERFLKRSGERVVGRERE